MELYNFFTEVVNDPDEIKNLKHCFEQLKPICAHVEFVLFTGITGQEMYSIIGQIYGDDTNVGDTDLFAILSGVKYTWFDAFNPEINNIKNN